ncbi:MAG: triose-phosphate isomerase [Candidatus Melainabacteria bacterium RIFOXYA2_FULL_32_9]|nr:MAG: triose-phosphate isomerase [Candidatus Melainabacteria bacterium RIFOXYA2_FULL_32_9]
MTRRPVIAGNWKLHKLVDEAVALTEDIKVKLMDLNKDAMPIVAVCPTFTALHSVGKILEHGKGIYLGAQDCYYKDSGAYTGEVSIPMLHDVGVTTVIIGHSERREYFGETNETVNLKAKAVLSHGLIPIICCGETLEQREAGVTDEHIATQIRAALVGISAEDIAKSVFAYEPIWAIGTGKTCDAQEANRVIKMIRSVIAEVSTQEAANQARILYGGSVKPSIIEEQMSMSDIDGALVGGASLEADSFVGIIKGTMAVRAK